jgi:hypothetical protein
VSDYADWILRNVLLGCGLVALGVILIAGLVEVWPAVTSLTGSAPIARSEQSRFLFGADTSLLVLAIIAGALGAYAGAALAFGEHLGVRDFSDSWTWWYVLRIPVGITIGVLVYFAFRGGFLSASNATKDVNPYGVGALAGLAGLFSRQATAKLEAAFGGGSGGDGDGTAGGAVPRDQGGGASSSSGSGGAQASS